MKKEYIEEPIKLYLDTIIGNDKDFQEHITICPYCMALFNECRKLLFENLSLKTRLEQGRRKRK